MLTPELQRKVFNDAITLLEKEGWIRGLSHSSLGYCMLGAIVEACSRNSVEYFIFERRICWTIGGDAIEFNDKIATSKEEVITVLEKTRDNIV